MDPRRIPRERQRSRKPGSRRCLCWRLLSLMHSNLVPCHRTLGRCQSMHCELSPNNVALCKPCAGTTASICTLASGGDAPVDTTHRNSNIVFCSRCFGSRPPFGSRWFGSRPPSSLRRLLAVLWHASPTLRTSSAIVPHPAHTHASGLPTTNPQCSNSSPAMLSRGAFPWTGPTTIAMTSRRCTSLTTSLRIARRCKDCRRNPRCSLVVVSFASDV